MIKEETVAGSVLVPTAHLLRDRFKIRHIALQPETGTLHDAIVCCDFPDRDAAPRQSTLHA